MKKLIPIFAVFFVLSTVGISHGEGSAKWFLEKYDNTSVSKFWWGTAFGQGYSGMLWMNSWLESKGRKPVFCPPDKIAFTDDQLIDIMRRYVKKNSDSQDDPFGFVLLYAVIDAFPCK